MKPKNLILHPSCPKRLITALRRAKGENRKGWNFSVLSRQLGVNKGIIHKLVTKGIEPRGEELRLKVFLPKGKRRPRKNKVRVELPAHMKWWRSLSKDQRDEMIRRLCLFGPL